MNVIVKWAFFWCQSSLLWLGIGGYNLAWICTLASSLTIHILYTYTVCIYIYIYIRHVHIRTYLCIHLDIYTHISSNMMIHWPEKKNNPLSSHDFRCRSHREVVTIYPETHIYIYISYNKIYNMCIYIYIYHTIRYITCVYLSYKKIHVYIYIYHTYVYIVIYIYICVQSIYDNSIYEKLLQNIWCQCDQDRPRFVPFFRAAKLSLWWSLGRLKMAENCLEIGPRLERNWRFFAMILMLCFSCEFF